jgi:hypothetical protein
MLALAACTGMNTTGGRNFAMRRECGGAIPDCATVCANAGLTCHNSIHVYSDPSHSAPYVKGMELHRYNSCGGGCGPNYCCCR